MAISLPQGFVIGATQPIDSRFILTKAQMLTINENTMPAQYFALCSDDKNFYIFDKTNEVDPELGKFRLFEAPVNQQDLAIKLPGAIEIAMSNPVVAQQIADAMFDSEHFQVTLDNKIDLAINLIQAIGPNEYEMAIPLG